MNTEAFRKILFFLIRSKVLFPGFLLLIAWIITIFAFSIYQPHESVEGIAIKKFSNLSPSPIPVVTVSSSVNMTGAVSLHSNSTGSVAASVNIAGQ
jgi:hypothetical protein